jgi:beta-glucosidase
LLQNKNKTLPISTSIKNLAIIGALADDPENQIGCWAPDGKAQDSITPLTSLKEALPNTKITFAAGYKSTQSTDTSLIAEALAAASSAEKILLFVGESNNMSG